MRCKIFRTYVDNAPKDPDGSHEVASATSFDFDSGEINITLGNVYLSAQRGMTTAEARRFAAAIIAAADHSDAG